MAQTCIGCHGAQLQGGRIPGAPPEWPPAANLNGDAGGAMGRYPSAETFKTMMRTGARPDGTKVDPVMPFAALRHMNDTDLQAMFLYLKSLGTAARNG